MLSFEVTTNYELVQQLLSDPRTYSRMANDAAPRRENFRAVMLRDDTTAILAFDDAATAGVFLLVDYGVGEVHFCFRPRAWGATEEIGRAFVEWVWAHTAFDRLIGPVPAYNRLALRLAKRCGFKPFDTRQNAVQKHGRPYDVILLELIRPS